MSEQTISHEHEIWKSVLDYNGYEVSNLGRMRSLDRDVVNNIGVKSRRTGKILKPILLRTGYLYVSLRDANGRKCHRLLHRIIITTFIGYSDLQVDHINKIKTDNNISNLQYVTGRENCCRFRTSFQDRFLSQMNGKKWRVRININGVPTTIGHYKTKEEAINERDMFLEKSPQHDIRQNIF